MKKLHISLNSALHLFGLLSIVSYFFAIKDLPLLGSFGAESGSLFAALFGPLFAMIAVVKLERDHHGFLQRLNQIHPTALFFTIFYTALIFFNMLGKQSCSEAAGFLWYLFFLLPPLMLHVLLGTAISCLTLRKRLKIALLFLFYVVYIGMVIIWWWQEPVFRLFSHLFIVFSSDLLAGIILNEAVLVFRFSTLMWAFFFYCLLIRIFPSKEQRIFRRRKHFLGSLLSFGLLFALAMSLQIQGIKLAGKNYHDLTMDYSLSLAKNGIIIKASPQALTKKEVELVLSDALFFQDKLKQKLGITGDTQPITIWLHKSSEEKFLYTGARHVHFALAHRREIHLSGVEVPHPVLGHELAHIFLGEFSNNSLKMPGVSLFLPNLGISEGLATYLTKELNVEDEISLNEMAKALWQSNIRINIADLFSINPLHFAKLNSSVAYLFSAAFLDFYLSTKPGEEISLIKKLVQHGTLSVAISHEQQKATLEAFVQTLEQPANPRAMALVNLQWQKEGILTKNCANNNQKELTTLRRSLWLGDVNFAQKILNQFSKENGPLLLNEAKYWLGQKRLQAALSVLSSINVTNLGVLQQNSFYLLKTRVLILLQNYEEAKETLSLIRLDLLPYSQFRYALSVNILLNNPDNEETLRYLANLSANNHNEYFAYSVGASKKRDPSEAERLSLYLLARFLMFDRQFENASNVLAAYFERGPELPLEIEHEALWMKANLSFTLAQFEHALEALNTLFTHKLSEGRMLEAKDLLLRIDLAKKEI